jgi:hypothetical protein
LFGGKNKQYGTYDANSIFASINGTSTSLVDNTSAVFSQEGELAKFEGAFVFGIDTLMLTLTGEPYVDPADIVPADYISYTITKAYIGKMSGFNTVSGNNDDIEIKILVPNGDWTAGVTADNFSYGSYLKVAGQKLKILRGELKVEQTNDIKTATIGLLCDDHIWYDITATTADAIISALDNINTTEAPTKVIENGQLIIIRGGVKYNAEGAIMQ